MSEVDVERPGWDAYERSWRRDCDDVIRGLAACDDWAVAEDHGRQREHALRRASESDHDASTCWCCCTTCLDEDRREKEDT